MYVVAGVQTLPSLACSTKRYLYTSEDATAAFFCDMMETPPSPDDGEYQKFITPQKSEQASKRSKPAAACLTCPSNEANLLRASFAMLAASILLLGFDITTLRQQKGPPPPLKPTSIQDEVPKTNAVPCPRRDVASLGQQGLLKSQSKEDEQLLDWFNGLCNGTYIEIGALDGERLSNSYVFNAALGWKGVLIELGSTNFARLKDNRPNELAVVNAAVCNERKTVHFVAGNEVGGIYEFTSPSFRARHKTRTNKTVDNTEEIECYPMREILIERAPEIFHYDFFSLDVEGAEYEVLRSTNFDRTSFGVIFVEASRHDPKKNEAVKEFLINKGYSFLKEDKRSYWFFHKEFKEIYGLQEDTQPSLFRSDSVKVAPLMKPAEDSWIHLEWHPRERKDRFPSVDERVRLYMSNWYLPPCNSSSQFAYKIDPSSESHHYATVSIKQPQLDRIERSDRLVQVSSEPIRKRCMFVQNSTTLTDCGLGKFDQHKSYCRDIANDADVLNLDTSSSPILAYLGDTRPEYLALKEGVLAPVLAKYRGATSKKDLLNVVECDSPGECTCISEKRHLQLNSQYQGELNNVIAKVGSATPEIMPFAPIIWKLHVTRHFGEVLDIARKSTIAWEDKIPKAIWRGDMTGMDKASARNKSIKKTEPEQLCHNIPRCNFVLRFFNLVDDTIDAAYVPTMTNDMTIWADEKGLTKDKMTIEEQLQYKILICLEGNDVSSGLKWMLLSNSIVLMPPPTRTSWAIEELLEPYVHYVPMAEDGSDAEEKVQWILDNDMEAQRIAERATLFMEDMLYHPDAKRDELEVKKEIVRRYREHWRPMPDSLQG